MCYILTKNLASFYQCPEKMNTVEFKDDGLICLLESISNQQNISGLSTADKFLWLLSISVVKKNK